MSVCGLINIPMCRQNVSGYKIIIAEVTALFDTGKRSARMPRIDIVDDTVYPEGRGCGSCKVKEQGESLPIYAQQ